MCKGMTLWKRQRCRGVPTWQLKKLTSIDVHLVIKYMQKFQRADWLRARQINPKQCRKLKLSAES